MANKFWKKNTEFGFIANAQAAEKAVSELTGPELTGPGIQDSQVNQFIGGDQYPGQQATGPSDPNVSEPNQCGCGAPRDPDVPVGRICNCPDCQNMRVIGVMFGLIPGDYSLECDDRRKAYNDVLHAIRAASNSLKDRKSYDASGLKSDNVVAVSAEECLNLMGEIFKVGARSPWHCQLVMSMVTLGVNSLSSFVVKFRMEHHPGINPDFEKDPLGGVLSGLTSCLDDDIGDDLDDHDNGDQP